MRTIFTILAFCFVVFQSQAQISTLHVKQGCSYDDALTENDLYLYDPSNEAERIVAEIVDALGLIKNFTVRSSNVPNALATTFNGTRYIFYSTGFLEKFKADANTQWAAYSVLAHEIGHHLNGHNFGETNPRTRKTLELEADQFSGSVLRMLGATIDEAQAGLNAFGLHGETNTHPPTTARKEAVSNGWKKRDEWLRERGMTVQNRLNNSVNKLSEKLSSEKTKEPCALNHTGELCLNNTANSILRVTIDSRPIYIEEGSTKCFSNLNAGLIEIKLALAGSDYKFKYEYDFRYDIKVCETVVRTIK